MEIQAEYIETVGIPNSDLRVSIGRGFTYTDESSATMYGVVYRTIDRGCDDTTFEDVGVIISHNKWGTWRFYPANGRDFYFVTPPWAI